MFPSNRSSRRSASIHNCDIARSTGQQLQDPDVLEAALEIGHQIVSPEFRTPGVLGPERPCGADAALDERLLAFGGREV